MTLRTRVREPRLTYQTVESGLIIVFALLIKDGCCIMDRNVGCVLIVFKSIYKICGITALYKKRDKLSERDSDGAAIAAGAKAPRSKLAASIAPINERPILKEIFLFRKSFFVGFMNITILYRTCNVL